MEFRGMKNSMLSAMAVVLTAVSTITFSQIAHAQVSSSRLDAELNRVVVRDSSEWWYHKYERGSMYNARVTKYAYIPGEYGRPNVTVMLVRGNFRYTNGMFGNNGYVIVRMHGDKVGCVSYDTGLNSECALEGGGTNYLWSAFTSFLWGAAKTWLFTRLGFG
jgi:hypothetical protein